MKRSISLMLLALALPHAGHAEDARSILQTMRDKQLARWEGVNLYVVEQRLMGQPSQTYFQRTEVEDDNGATQTLFLPVQPESLASCDDTRRMTPDELRAHASGMGTTGDAVAGEIENGMVEAGLPPGLLAASGSDSTASHMAQFMAKARLQGTETVNGRRTYHIRAGDLENTRQVEGGEFTLDLVSMWIDAEHYVPLVTRMDGEMTSNGETRPVTIERLDADYRRVPGSSLYEPYKQVLKMSGMMDPAREAEMREARAQMAQMEQQMAAMPAEQRAMMEKMMGPQLEMMRNMAAGGGFQMEISVERITANPSGQGRNGWPCAPDSTTIAAATQGGAGPAQAGKAAADNLTAMVQKDLTALGYDTGGASGEMNTATVVAISRFQAENGLEVTGEVTPQLAGMLSARASGSGNTTAAAAHRSPAKLAQARQACLQEKFAAAQEAQRKQRGFGRLMSGVGRIANRFGGDFGREMAEVSRDVYDVNATAADLSQAAKDLGLTENDIEACRNP